MAYYIQREHQCNKFLIQQLYRKQHILERETIVYCWGLIIAGNNCSFSKCVIEASYAWKLKKPIIPLRMEPDFKPVDWLGFILGTKLYIDVFSDDEMTKNMEALIKAIGNRGRISCDEVDGMQSYVI